MRNIARALVPEQGPEAAAIVNLNSEETRDVRGSEVDVSLDLECSSSILALATLV